MSKREREAADVLASRFKRTKLPGEDGHGVFAVMDQVAVHIKAATLHPPEANGTEWWYVGEPAWCALCGHSTAMVLLRSDGRRHCMGCAAVRSL